VKVGQQSCALTNVLFSDKSSIIVVNVIILIPQSQSERDFFLTIISLYSGGAFTNYGLTVDSTSFVFGTGKFFSWL